MQQTIPASFTGFEIGTRRAMAEQLAAMNAACEPVAYLVAEQRDGDWCLGDEWVTRHTTVDDARADAERTRAPYVVGVLAVVPVDGGRLYPDPDAQGQPGVRR